MHLLPRLCRGKARFDLYQLRRRARAQAGPAGREAGGASAVDSARGQSRAVRSRSETGIRMKRGAGIFLTALGRLILAGLAVCVAGCARQDPLGRVVAASNDMGLMMWKADHAGDLGAEDLKAFDEAVQEIKYQAMAPGAADGTSVQERIYGRIDGVSVREIVKTGFGFKLQRLTQQRGDLEAFIARNSRLRTRAGDDESADYLKDFKEKQTAKLAGLDQQIQATEAVLHRFDGTAAPASVPGRTDAAAHP
jgi:hypothetical protein